MKKRIILITCGILLALAGCGAKNAEDNGLQKEPIPAVEDVQKTSEEDVSADQTEEKPSEATISQEQALEAIKNYCYANIPELEGMAESEDYTMYFDVSTNEANEIVVLYRSYTGAQIRYYVDPSSGEVYVTELVPGIIDEEQRTDETFNIRDYMDRSAKSAETGDATGKSLVTRKDGERYEDVIILEGMEETVKYEHARNDAVGIEIDYDHESFVRQSDSDKERFISVYDDAGNPENYLDVTYSPENIDTLVSTISAELSKEYELSTDTYELDYAGNCTRIDASACVGGEVMPEHLQKVYIVPAENGTVVATAHYSIESAEGFGRRFAYMMNTLIVAKQ